jgi:hypothetical protein
MEEQCKGITKSGNRCKIKQGLVNGYCRLHTDQDPGNQRQTIDKDFEELNEKRERDITDVASDVNKGLTTIMLIFTALLSFIIYLFFKRIIKRKKR